MDKKGILGIGILAILLMTWPAVSKKIERTFGWGNPIPPQKTEKSNLDNDIEITRNDRDAEKKEVKVPKKITKTIPKTIEETKTETEAKIIDLQEVVIAKNPDVMKISIDPDRGITIVELEKYKNNARTAKMQLGDKNFAAFSLSGSAKNWQYGQTKILSQTESSLSVKQPVMKKSLSITRTWEMDKESDYVFKFTLKIKNTGLESKQLNNLRLNCGYLPPILHAEGFMAQNAMGFDQSVDFYKNSENKVETNFFVDVVEKIKENPESEKLIFNDSFKWIAVKNQYFASIVQPDNDMNWSGCAVYSAERPYVSPTGKVSKDFLVAADGILPEINLKPGEEKELTFSCFYGPQELNRLKALGDKKKQIMQMSLLFKWKVGWLGFISEIMLTSLLFFYSFTKSYGMAIIMLTLCVKLLFWRMTQKSSETSKKMAIVGPKLKELRDTHKNDPRKMQEESMKIYREYKINPLAGCLPLFFQMPVFIALFNTLRGAIELRQSEFLWIHDLSLPDTVGDIFGIPIRPLAVMWAITMFLQQKVMPTSGDPMQKKMMKFLPIFMLFLCYGMPSGLTLYWTISTGMTILQYHFINKKNILEPNDDKSKTRTQKTVTAKQ